MKRYNLIVITALTLALCAGGALAKDSFNLPGERYYSNEAAPENGKTEILLPNERWSSNEYAPDTKAEIELPNERWVSNEGAPDPKWEKLIPNEVPTPGLCPLPEVKNENNPTSEPWGYSQEERPYLEEEAPTKLLEMPTGPQMSPGPPPRGYQPVPPPQNPGGGWAEGKKLSRWFNQLKFWEQGD